MVNVNLPGSRAQFMEDNVWCLKEINILKNLSEASYCSMENFDPIFTVGKAMKAQIPSHLKYNL